MEVLDISNEVGWKHRMKTIFRKLGQSNFKNRVIKRKKFCNELCHVEWDKYNSRKRNSKPEGLSIVDVVNQEIGLIEGKNFDIIHYLRREFMFKFDAIKAFHGCRVGQVGDENSYKEKGLIILTTEKSRDIITKYGFEYEEIRSEPTGICFFLEKESHFEVSFESNNFLCCGSEMISCNSGGRDYNNRWQNIGNPCIIHCHIPINFIGEDSLNDILEHLVERYFGYNHRSGGLQIQCNLPPENIDCFEYVNRDQFPM